MKCYISEETVNVLNDLLKEFFKGNSVADNIAYNLDAMGLHKCAAIYHENFAHYFPSEADVITERMTKLNAKAVRRGFSGDENTYSSITEAFRASFDLAEHMRERILNAIDILDYDINNKEVILMLEDVSVSMLDKLYMSNVWFQYAEYYDKKEKVMQFDQNFDKFFSVAGLPESDDD